MWYSLLCQCNWALQNILRIYLLGAFFFFNHSYMAQVYLEGKLWFMVAIWWKQHWLNVKHRLQEITFSHNKLSLIHSLYLQICLSDKCT
jgi:hypothetical protein